MAVLAAADEHVRRERGEARGDRPDVEVVHLDDSRCASEPLADRACVDPARRGLEQDRGRVAQDRPRAHEDEHADQDADERVGLEPAGRENDDRRDDDPDRAEEVGNDVPERGLDVEIAAAAAKQDRSRRRGSLRLRPGRSRAPSRRARRAGRESAGTPRRRSRSRARRARRRSRAPPGPPPACSRTFAPGVAGRSASQTAKSASASATLSESMCTASARSARLPVASPPTTSTTV